MVIRKLGAKSKILTCRKRKIEEKPTRTGRSWSEAKFTPKHPIPHGIFNEKDLERIAKWRLALRAVIRNTRLGPQRSPELDEFPEFWIPCNGKIWDHIPCERLMLVLRYPKEFPKDFVKLAKRFVKQEKAKWIISWAKQEPSLFELRMAGAEEEDDE